MGCRVLYSLLTLVAAWACSPALAAEQAPWAVLFNGEDFAGWHLVGGAKWTVEDGTILGQTGDGSYGWLVTNKQYSDFELELKFKHEGPGNSGVQFRSHVIDGVMCGYQAEVDPRPDYKTGGVYEEKGRGWLVEPDETGRRAHKPGQWNHYCITAVRDHIVLHLNGVKTTDFHDPKTIKGIIALQVHSGKKKPVKVRFKDIRIRDRAKLPAARGFVSLFNGKDLDGWKVHGDGKWTVQDGQIVAASTSGKYSYLVSENAYDNFVLKAAFKYEGTQNNSGVFFRCRIKGVDIRGPQCEVSPKIGGNTAGIYESGGRGWVKKPSDRAQKVLREGDWNELQIRADGDHVVTHLNGFEVTNFRDDKLAREGILALQIHSGQGVKVRFKDLWIKPLTRPSRYLSNAAAHPNSPNGRFLSRINFRCTWRKRPGPLLACPCL